MLSFIRKAFGFPPRRAGGLTEICVICQDHLDVPSEVVCMPGCTHLFHGRCLVQQLMYSQRCPICRGGASYDGDDNEADVSTDSMPPRILIAEAIETARNDANATSRTRRSLQTIRKWDRTLDQLTRQYRRNRRATRARRAEAMKRAEREFKSNNKDLITEGSELRRKLTHARTHRQAARRRVATQYGYVQSWS